jgi:ankyrin repeat protein
MLTKKRSRLLLAGFLLNAYLLSGCDIAPKVSKPVASSGTLYEAIASGRFEEVRDLVLDNVDLDEKTLGQTPLHQAILLGRQDVARLLIDRGADVNAQDEEGRRPLHYAVWQNQMAVASALLSHGADVHAVDKHGMTPLSITGYSELSKADAATTPGMVVCIDVAAKEALVPCRKAYDRTVVGIVSGAGNLGTGMRLGVSDDKSRDGQPIALTGRVYCWVDATLAPVRPGDFLTTSNTLGHAMKATDFSRAQGAIVGKAMSTLENGKGLVLVFVTLQ